MRAGISGFEELPYSDDLGEPIIGAAVPDLDHKLSRFERLVELLFLALTDSLNSLPDVPIDQIPLIIGLAELDRPGGGGIYAQQIIRAVEKKLAVRFHQRFSKVIAEGNTSGFMALRLADKLIRAHNVPACLVCGVDSYINASALNWLDRHWRLKTEDNSDGVIPGEAAAAVMVSAERSSRTFPDVRVIGMGFAQEKAYILSDQPLLGLGLAEAARRGLAAAKMEMHEIDFRLSDLTGESYGFKEQGLSEMKLMRSHREELLPLWHIAESTGDTGAAAGVCQLVLSFHAFRGGYAPGASVLCYTSAILGGRAVAVLRVTAT